MGGSGVDLRPYRRLAAAVFIRALKDLKSFCPERASKMRHLAQFGERRRNGALKTSEWIRFGLGKAPPDAEAVLVAGMHDPREFLLTQTVFHDVLDLDVEKVERVLKDEDFLNRLLIVLTTVESV